MSSLNRSMPVCERATRNDICDRDCPKSAYELRLVSSLLTWGRIWLDSDSADEDARSGRDLGHLLPEVSKKAEKTSNRRDGMSKFEIWAWKLEHWCRCLAQWERTTLRKESAGSSMNSIPVTSQQFVTQLAACTEAGLRYIIHNTTQLEHIDIAFHCITAGNGLLVSLQHLVTIYRSTGGSLTGWR